MKGAGVVAGATMGVGGASAVVDDALDTDGGVQEIVVVFEENEDVTDLERFDLPNGYYRYDVLPFAHTRATGEQIEQIAALESVRYVQENRELELHNDDARELTGAEAVQDPAAYGVTGEDVHVAVIDTGITFHRDLQDSVVHNYRYVNPTTSRNDDQVWVDFGDADADDLGHGSHVTGSISGDGVESDGRYRGMAPDVTVTSYATNVGVFVAMLAAAVDDMLRKQREGEANFQLVNNSFGSSHDGDFNPADAANVAYWEAFREGILPVFSASNDGSDHGTLNYLGKQPYSLCVAATYDGDFGREKAPTDFSSRGRPPASDEGKPYAADYDFDRYADNEGPHYDRRTALQNVRQFHASGQDDAALLDTETVEATVEPTVSDVVLGETLVGGGSTFVDLTSPDGTGYLDAHFEMTPPRQTVYVTLWRGSSEDDEADRQRVADGGRFINDGTFELQVPVDGGTRYTLEFYGFNNVQTDIAGELRWLDRVPRPDGPFGMYRCDVGAPGNEVVSTITHREGLTYLAPLGGDSHTADPWYDAMSGTSMSCPVVVGCTALVFQAYKDAAGHFPKPIDVINIVEVTAEGGTDEEQATHTQANMGAGFIDVEAAVGLARELGERAADGGNPGRSGDAPGQGGDNPGQGEGPPEHAGPDGSDDPTKPDHPELWDQVVLCSYAGPEAPPEGEATDHETVHTVQQDTLANGSPVWGSPRLLLTAYTEAFEVPADAFDDTDLPERRLTGEMTWNPSDEGPNNVHLYVQRRVNDQWEDIAYERSTVGPEVDDNHVEFELRHGDAHDGNVVVIDGGETYRFGVEGSNGVADFEIVGEFQGYEVE